MFNLVDETAQGACPELADVLTEVVLVDTIAQSDGFGEAVDLHRATPGRGTAKRLGYLARSGVQVVRATVIKGPGHTVAARSDTASDTGAYIGVAQQLSSSFGRHGSPEGGQVNSCLLYTSDAADE